MCIVLFGREVNGDAGAMAWAVTRSVGPFQDRERAEQYLTELGYGVYGARLDYCKESLFHVARTGWPNTFTKDGLAMILPLANP